MTIKEFIEVRADWSDETEVAVSYNGETTRLQIQSLPGWMLNLEIRECYETWITAKPSAKRFLILFRSDCASEWMNDDPVAVEYAPDEKTACEQYIYRKRPDSCPVWQFKAVPFDIGVQAYYWSSYDSECFEINEGGSVF